ncbi:MAG: hypothetical protein KGJ60_08835 [Verrucomicrobiota bacterium]|nr:hypothetical protein [Verrucomicrobiota bacterium]
MWPLLLMAALLAGCGRGNGVKVYQLANDQSAPPPPSQTSAPPRTEGAAPPSGLQWSLPAGWTEASPGEMSVASFQVPGQNGGAASVSIVPLPGLAGGVEANVNRWRGQVGLDEASPDEIQKSAQSIQAGDQPAQLFDILGKNSGGESSRILAAIQRRGDTTWFIKMIGAGTLVEQQKPAFIAFLKSLKFPAAAPAEALPPGHPPVGGADTATPMTGSIAAETARPAWTVPADWKEVPTAQFLVAEYSIAGANGGGAAVNVAELAGDGGGLLPNVNRWRQQIGLDAVGGDDLGKVTATVAVAGGQATLVDWTGASAGIGGPVRLVGAIVPVAGQTWFYKLMGEPSVVAAQKDAFVKFVQTAKYSHAP